MRSTQANGRHTADPPRQPPGARGGPTARPPGTAPAGADGAAEDEAREAARPPGPEPGDDRPADPRAVDDDVAGAVRQVLERVLADRLAHCRELDAVFAHDVAERVAHSTLHGGGRLRPRFLWWAFRACGGEDPARTRAALRAGAALELLQTCALVHDDVMDAAPTRRGGPAVHAGVARQYAGVVPGAAARHLGASAAVLAGDLALAWADDVVADLLLDEEAGAGAARRLRDVWRTMRTEMAAGQYLDVHGGATSVFAVARALRAARLKSALYTVARPLELGAALAGADPGTTRVLCRAGRCAGLAFQLRDDLDDVFADPRDTGKPSAGDVRQGKPTYLLAVARARATAAGDRTALDVLDHCVGRADLSESALARVRDVLVATGARDLVGARIAHLTEQALRHLGEAPCEPRAAAGLRRLLCEATGTAPDVPAPGGPPPGAALAAAGREAGR
ncbi:polyprenyl synthetase family protein [Streptomyces glaucus]|uniref:Polyprenyl synthetase family protein n=1 Tax=Streptomyces glaucus TaxID=284029 RepID=A0ABP5XLS1_9ACTN